MIRMLYSQDIDGYIERASQSGVGLLRQAGQRGFQAVASGVAQSNVISMVRRRTCLWLFHAHVSHVGMLL